MSKDDIGLAAARGLHLLLAGLALRAVTEGMRQADADLAAEKAAVDSCVCTAFTHEPPGRRETGPHHDPRCPAYANRRPGRRGAVPPSTESESP